MSIYSEVLACEEMLDKEYDALTGEVTEENEANIAILNEWKDKIVAQGIENLCKVRANYLAAIDSLKAEKKRIADKQSTMEKKLDRLEGYITMIYEKAGTPKVDAGTFTVSMRKSESVELKEGFEDKLYGKYEFVPDKKQIKEALKLGAYIEGAKLVEKQNLQVK